MTGDEFKEWRKALGLNQDEAATALGVSRATIGNYEAGRRREDDRLVEIPLTVELACDAVLLAEAARRRDLNILPMAWQGRVRVLAGLLTPCR